VSSNKASFPCVRDDLRPVVTKKSEEIRLCSFACAYQLTMSSVARSGGSWSVPRALCVDRIMKFALMQIKHPTDS
jgi:hypothetical protein